MLSELKITTLRLIRLLTAHSVDFASSCLLVNLFEYVIGALLIIFILVLEDQIFLHKREDLWTELYLTIINEDRVLNAIATPLVRSTGFEHWNIRLFGLNFTRFLCLSGL